MDYRKIEDLSEKTLRVLCRNMFYMLQNVHQQSALGNPCKYLLTVPEIDLEVPHIYVYQPTNALVVLMTNHKEKIDEVRTPADAPINDLDVVT